MPTSTASKSSRSLVAKYKNVVHHRHTHCRICERKLPAPCIKLPAFPMTEIYVAAKPRQPLALLDQAFSLCPHCGHGQLLNTIPAEVLYGDTYVTRTSGSSAKKAIDDFLAFVLPKLPARPLGGILEVGCNDLYTLNCLADRAESLCGIDPIWKNRRPEKLNPKIRVIGEFFESVDLGQIGMTPEVVICSHTLEHIDDPVALLTTLVAAATSETQFFFQFPGLEPLVQDGRFDQLHHQHLNYFTLQSVIAALERAGAELLAYDFNFYHWGALMISFRKAPVGGARHHARFLAKRPRLTSALVSQRYLTFKKACLANDASLAALLQNRPIYGFGAALMLPLLAYHLPHLAQLACIIDDDPHKQGQYYINFPLKIVPLQSLGDLTDATVAVTAINSKQNIRAITQKLIQLNVRDIFLPVTTL
jgi:hypothetical protein